MNRTNYRTNRGVLHRPGPALEAEIQCSSGEALGDEIATLRSP